MTRTNAWHAGLAAVAVLLLCSVGRAGAGGPPSVLGVPCSELSAQHLYMQTNVRAYLVVKGCAAPARSRTTAQKAALPQPRSRSPPRSAAPTATSSRPRTRPFRTTRRAGAWSPRRATRSSSTTTIRATSRATSPARPSRRTGATRGRASTRSRRATARTSVTRCSSTTAASRSSSQGNLVSGGCGTLGIGTWTSSNGQTWAPRPCVHSGSADDRPSIAVDNDPTSPFYGNTYVSWNDFKIGSGALVFSRSTDGGVTWSAEQIISNTVHVPPEHAARRPACKRPGRPRRRERGRRRAATRGRTTSSARRTVA